VSIKLELDVKQYYLYAIERTKKFVTSFTVWHLLLISLILHTFVMCFPNDGGMVFDEVHYVKATEAHVLGIGANAEHMPLVKVFMSWMFRIFGDYWFTWRFPIVISCIIAMLAFYYIAEHFLGDRYALLATAFLSLDTVFFIHGTIYLLDMPAIMFGLGSIALYLKSKPKWSAVAMGLAILCKEITILFAVPLLIYMVYNNWSKLRSGKHESNKMKLSTFLWIPLSFILITGSIVLGSLWIYDASYKVGTGVQESILIHNIVDQNGTPITTTTETKTSTVYLNNPIENLKWMLTYHGGMMANLNMTYVSYEKPWNWILPLDLDGVFDRPVYYAVKVTAGEKVFYPVDYQAQATLPIWYFTLPALGLAVYDIATKKRRKLGVFLLAMLTCTGISWIGIELLKHSTGFNYYFIYAVPFVCLGIAHFWKTVQERQILKISGVSCHLLLTLLFFLVYFPIGVFH